MTASIEAMAREAMDVETDARGRVTLSCDSYGLTRFAALVRAQALEEAAQKVDHYADLVGGFTGVNFRNCAAAIRALPPLG